MCLSVLRKKCGVTRVQHSGVVSSLKMIVGVLDTLYSIYSRGINAFSSNDGMENGLDWVSTSTYSRAGT